MIFFLTILLGVCIAVALGIIIGVYLVARQDRKEDAEQTWERTAAKETKPPLIAVVGKPPEQVRADVIKLVENVSTKRDSELTARLRKAATPEGQRKAAANVRRKLKKAK